MKMEKRLSHIEELRSADRKRLGFEFKTELSEVFNSKPPVENFVLITKDRKTKELSNKLFNTNYEC